LIKLRITKFIFGKNFLIEIAKSAAHVGGEIAKGTAHVSGEVVKGAVHVSGEVVKGTVHVRGEISGEAANVFGGNASTSLDISKLPEEQRRQLQ
jgi:hypothetical protein